MDRAQAALMNASGSMRRVLFAERRLPHYRTAFVSQLRTWLQIKGVHLDFIYGHGCKSEQSKEDAGELPWAQRMRSTNYFVNDKVVWQPFDTHGYDLVIVSQENGLLFNHWLARPWRSFLLAYFGHGANFNALHTQTLRERYRRYSTRQADWWFAYTAISQGLVERAGFPPNRITVVNNTTDTTSLRDELARSSAQRLQALRSRYGLTIGKTALFLSSLYAGKGLDLLLTATRIALREEPELRVLVVGDGPIREQMQKCVQDTPQVQFLGALRGQAKAELLAVSDFMVIPGSVGLSIVDAFVAGLPLLTTQTPGHGPEIAYLRPGRNGDIITPSAEHLALAMTRLCTSPELLGAWRAQAKSDGDLYSLDGMASRFGQGVLDALALRR
jgi:L-malate glycosyltransferase